MHILSPSSIRLALALALPLGLTACDPGSEEDDSDPDSWAYPDWSTKSDDLGSGLTATRDAVVQIFDGYNRVTDTPGGRNCVLPSPGPLELAAFRAGGDVLTTELQYISTREELEEALGIDAQATIKVGPLGGGGSFGFAKTYKSSENTLAILLRTRQMYTVVNQQRHNLTDEALGMLESDASQFVRECGTGYIAGVAYGAELSLLIQIETSSLAETMEIKSKLETQGIKAGPATIDASLGQKFTSALENESAKVSVKVEARGFVPKVDINALGALDANAFMVAGTAQKELQDSVALDKCHDQGDSGPGTCGGAPARGYLANGARVGVPMGVLALPFTRTANLPGDQAIVDGLLEVNRAADNAIAVLEDYADIYRTMVGIHNDEVGAMLDSDAPYDFAIFDPSDELRAEITFTGLQSIASEWADAYEPEGGSEVRKLADLVQVCWSRAQFGDFSDCQTDPAETSEGQEILATIQEYAGTRIRPVYYTFAPDAVEWDIAADECATGFRPPTASEAARLWSAVERNPGIPESADGPGVLQSNRGAWFDDKGVDCREEEGAFIERLSSGQFATGCHENGFFSDDPELVALCVPTSGVYGSSVPEL
jgi:hypothetical protein